MAALPPSSSNTRFLPAIDLRYQPTLALPVNESVAKRSSRTSDSATATSHGSTWTRAPRSTGFIDQIGELERGERRLGRGLQDDRATAGERGRELVANEVEREVE